MYILQEGILTRGGSGQSKRQSAQIQASAPWSLFVWWPHFFFKFSGCRCCMFSKGHQTETPDFRGAPPILRHPQLKKTESSSPGFGARGLCLQRGPGRQAETTGQGHVFFFFPGWSCFQPFLFKLSCFFFVSPAVAPGFPEVAYSFFLFLNPLWSPGVRRFLRKKDPWKWETSPANRRTSFRAFLF